MAANRVFKSLIEKCGFDHTKSIILQGHFEDVTREMVVSELSESVGDVFRVYIPNDYKNIVIEFETIDMVLAIEENVTLNGESYRPYRVHEAPTVDQQLEELGNLRVAFSRLLDEKKEAEEKLLEERAEWEKRLERLERFATDAMASPQASSREATPTSRPVVQTMPATTRVPPTGIHIPVMPDANENITVQVEHIVEGESGGFSNKIRPFSGNAPRNGEADFEEWSKHMELILEDEHLSMKGKRRKLLGSLHAPALDLARGLGDITAIELFREMEKLYGYTSNGIRLLQDLFKMEKKASETATEYLQRLGVQMGKVEKRKGLRPDQVNETLVAHFVASCADERIAQMVHLKYDKGPSPSLPELMKEVRLIEDTFESFHKGQTPNGRARQHSQQVLESPDGFEQLQSMQLQLNDIQARMGDWAVSSTGSERTAVSNTHYQANNNRDTSVKKNLRKKKGYFCYNCGGTDGHYKQRCRNPANPSLVFERLNENSKDSQSGPSHNQNLNGRGPQ